LSDEILPLGGSLQFDVLPHISHMAVGMERGSVILGDGKLRAQERGAARPPQKSLGSGIRRGRRTTGVNLTLCWLITVPSPARAPATTTSLGAHAKRDAAILRLILSSARERVVGVATRPFGKHLGHTKDGKSFRNVEYFRLRDGTVEALECYFGGNPPFRQQQAKGHDAGFAAKTL